MIKKTQSVEGKFFFAFSYPDWFLPYKKYVYEKWGTKLSFFFLNLKLNTEKIFKHVQIFFVSLVFTEI